MKHGFNTIKLSCYLSYLTQGIVNNFLPLLFVFFNTQYGVNVSTLGLIALYSFLIQLAMDLLSSLFICKIGYKITGIIANFTALSGLILLAVLPKIMPIIPAIFIASTFYCGGSGLAEVVISPIIESLPSKRKAFDMGITHSMYSFGSFLTILISFFFFLGLGVNNWWILALIFVLVPTSAIILFIFNKYPDIEQSNKEDIQERKPFYKNFLFYLIFLLMIAAGSTEIGMSDWASTYAEMGLGVIKPFGDLYGPALFALCMGVSRFIYALISQKIKLKILLIGSGFIALVGYLLAALSNIPIINFIGVMLAGIGVAAMWPGTITLTARYFKNSTRIYSFLAAAGDIGCSFGAYMIGLIASGLNLKIAILIGSIFPLFFFIFSFIFLFIQEEK